MLADGFYEWRRQGEIKTPYYISLASGEPFALAGLWENWQGKESGESLQTTTLITTDANAFMQPLHHRMPVILKSEFYEPWLDSQNHDLDALKSILKNEIHTDLVSYPVSKQVNSASHNNPSCIEPIA